MATAAPMTSAAFSSSTADGTAVRFGLTGRSIPLDRRVHAWRNDLADIALAGRVLAPHYAAPLARACGSRPVMVWPTPGAEGDAVSELLPGEGFAVLEYAGGYAWGYCTADHAVGYVEAIELAAPEAPTHIVCERFAAVAPDDRVTSPLLATLPMGTQLQGSECGACLNTEYGCVALSHLRRIDEHDEDPVIVAERLIGAPFLPGGRTANGVDADGLVQLSLALCGMPGPRFADQQRQLGSPVGDGIPPHRGDLVFFDGGAGLMIDDLMMIHASRAAGKVTAEPLALHPHAELRRL